MRKMGLSNQFYHTATSGRYASVDIQISIRLKETVRKDKLREALKKALTFFPEFAIRPVITNNQFYQEDNNEDIPIFNGESGPDEHFFGSDEVNGYLFVVTCSEKKIDFSIFHGLTDFYGAWMFVYSILFQYGIACGLDFKEDALVRCSRIELEDDERYDPYRKYGTYEIKPDFRQMKKIMNEVYNIKDKGLIKEDYCYATGITVDGQKFGKASKKYRSTPVLFLAYLVSLAISDTYDIGDKKILANIPADMRPVYKSSTVVNFSDSINLSFSKADREKTTQEVIDTYKKEMKAALKTAYFDNLIASKKGQFTALSKSGIPLKKIMKMFGMPISDKTKLPFTYGLSFLGNIWLSEDMKKIVERIEPGVYCNSQLTVGAYANDNQMVIGVLSKYDLSGLIKNLCKRLEENEVEIVNITNGTSSGNKLFYEKIKKEGKEYKFFNPFRRVEV